MNGNGTASLGGRAMGALASWRDEALFAGLRGAFSVPQVVGTEWSMQIARQLGRGFAASGVNRKRMERAAANLAQAMPWLDDQQRWDIAASAYRHLFMLGVEISMIPRLITDTAWPDHVELGPLATGLRAMMDRFRRENRPVVMLTGHCGNWEVLGYTLATIGFPMHVLYRPLDFRPADKWIRQTRARRGLELVDKFGAAERLPELVEANESVGFVADQNAGDKGLFVPFFGRLASTYKSIGLLVMRYNAVLVCGYAHRIAPDHAAGLARERSRGLHYRIDVPDVIFPEDWRDQPDPLFYLTARYRRAIETMVLSAPEQYLWMHRIWKSRPRHEVLGRPFPKALRAKLESLPWLDAAGVEAIADRSERDSRYLVEHGVARLP